MIFLLLYKKQEQIILKYKKKFQDQRNYEVASPVNLQ